jgi:ATP-dependent Zn protease
MKDERDIEDQLSHLRRIGPLDLTENELLLHCEKRAGEIVRANKDVVLRLATLLSEHGVVEGHELQAILNKVRAPDS